MKKLTAILTMLLLVFALASCTVVVKEHPGRWAVVTTTGADVIKVWKVDGLSGETLQVLEPGTKVKILKVRPYAVMIELPSGDTGWVNRKHFSRDLEEF